MIIVRVYNDMHDHRFVDNQKITIINLNKGKPLGRGNTI